MSQSNLTQRPHWLITRHKVSSLEVLTIDSEDDEQVLPIFSFEEEAQLFLRFCEAGRGWKVRETSPGELISVLSGPCAEVSEVALDPVPEVCGAALLGLLSVERDEFVEVLLEDKFTAPRPIPSRIKRPIHSKPPYRMAHVAASRSSLFSS
ncbi:MAG TPA: hypothetical protein VK902_19715 [Rubrobacter sp.]|nr:hypothetical protein [Rubrobacter sp.]